MGGISGGTNAILERIAEALKARTGDRGSGIFDNVDFVAISYLLERCSIRALKAGEILIGAGEKNSTLYFVLSGSLSVHLESKESDPVAICGVGNTLGELSVIDGNPASAFVVAKTDVELLAMVEDTFWDLVRISHAFSVNLILFMAGRMRQTNTTMTQGLRLKNQFERDAMFDALTSLHNRRWFDASFPRFLQRHQMDGKPLSVLMLDIDRFKLFNDTYGHAAGDEVLAMVARTIREQLRPTDSGVRMGGEEFLVIFPETDLPGAVTAAERLRKAVSRATVTLPDGKALPSVTVSIGVSLAGAKENGADLVARADAALYRAKNGGRDRVES